MALLILLYAIPLSVFPVDGPNLPITLSATLMTLPATAEITAARSAYETARIEAIAAGYRGDLLFSLTPTWKQSWLPGSDLDPFHELSLSAGATLPLGLSSADRARLDRAVQRLRIAEADLRATTLDVATALAGAWLRVHSAVREITVLDAEADALRMQLAADETLFLAGELSLGDLLRSRDAANRAELAAENGRIRAESAAVELLLRTGFPIERELVARLIEIPPTAMDLPEIAVPQVEEVIAQLRRDTVSGTVSDAQIHPRIVRQDALVQIARTDTDISRDPILTSVRLALSADDHSGSISYSFPRPSLSLGYTPPAYGIGTPLPSGSGRDSGDQNTVTFSAVFSLGVGSSREQSAAAATVAATQEAYRLDALLRSLEAEMTARYRQIAAAEAAAALALQALARAEATEQAIAARTHLGMATVAESAVAAAAVARAHLTVLDAEAAIWSASLAYVAVAHLPDSLPPIFHTLLSGGLPNE